MYEKVDPDKLEEFAKEMNKEIASEKDGISTTQGPAQTAIEKIREVTFKLLGNGEDVGVWQGPAADAFAKEFDKAFDNYLNTYRYFAMINAEISKKSEEFQAKDRVASNIADSIEQAQWAAV